MVTSIGWAQGSPYSPYAEEVPRNVYWGDTHLRTSLSVDAYMFGNRLTPDLAYRFANGEAITASNGMKARLYRPLDFLVIADHSDNMGVMVAAEAKDPKLFQTEEGRRMSTRLKAINEKAKTDPIKAEELSFYYLRVLEIPTPRWTAYDAKYFKLKDLPEEIPMVIQERAYTSPIWYTP